MKHKREPKRGRASQRGSAMLVCLVFTTLILMAGLGSVAMATREQMAARQQSDQIVSRNVAEGGVDYAMWQLKQTPTWRCAGNPVAFTNAPLSVQVAGKTLTMGTYTVRPIQDLPDGNIQVTADAFAYNAAGQPGSRRTISLLCYSNTTNGPLSQGMFGKQRVQLNGNCDTDSYNSANAAYGGDNRGYNGDIRTNASNANAITLNGNSSVKGHVIFGPNTNLAGKRFNGNVSINANDGNPADDMFAAPNTLTLPNISMPSGGTNLNTYLGVPQGNVNWNGNQNITLPSGTYRTGYFNMNGNGDLIINGDVTLIAEGYNFNGNAQIIINGSLTVYSNGPVNFNGNVGNNPGGAWGDRVPRNFIVYGTPNCGSVKLNGNTEISGVVYAPNANVTWNGNVDFFGAVLGDSIDLNGNCKFHYDETLASLIGGSSGDYEARTWREQ